MIQEQKELLLKDLCSRSPYGVKCTVYEDAGVQTLSGVLPNNIYNELYFGELDWKECNGFANVQYCKPYLFPLSSMTEAQKNELSEMEWSFDNSTICNIVECFGTYRAYVDHSCCSELIDWFHKNHFDYRGLIPMGLALDATGKNIY